MTALRPGMTNPSRGTPSVSVIIPAYNRAEQLHEVVASVLAQTYAAHEILVVDDGSRDHTPEVARTLPEPVRYIRQENQGVSGARNRGLSEASGDLVALLDSDDRWDSRKLEVQVGVMRAHPEAGWSATDIRVVRTGEPDRVLGGMERAVPVFREQRHRPSEWFQTRLEPHSHHVGGVQLTSFVGDAFGLLLNGNFVFPSTVILRRSMMDEVGMFDPAFPRAEETEFFLRLAAASPLAMIDLPLTTYRTGAADTLTANVHTVELTEFALRALNGAVARRREMSEYEQHAARSGTRALLLRQAYAHLSNLDSAEARKSLVRLRREGLKPGAKGSAIAALSYLPSPLLRALRSIKGATDLGPRVWPARERR